MDTGVCILKLNLKLENLEAGKVPGIVARLYTVSQTQAMTTVIKGMNSNSLQQLFFHGDNNVEILNQDFLYSYLCEGKVFSVIVVHYYFKSFFYPLSLAFFFPSFLLSDIDAS